MKKYILIICFLFTICSIFAACEGDIVENNDDLTSSIISTPFGQVPEKCIYDIPNRSHKKIVEGGLEISHEDGTTTFHKFHDECAEYFQNNPLVERNERSVSSKNELSQNIECASSKTKPFHGWLLNMYNQLEDVDNNTFESFEGDYTVPANPSSPSQQKDSTVYYFIGTQGKSGYIAQPVLTYGYHYDSNTWSWFHGWYFRNWDCCHKDTTGKTIYGVSRSTQVFYVKPGDIIKGKIYRTTKNGDLSVGITASLNGTNESINFTTKVNNYKPEYLDATLEAYGVDKCLNFPVSSINGDAAIMKFSNMKLVPNNEQGWYIDQGPGFPSECDTDVQNYGFSEVTLKIIKTGATPN